MILAWAALLAAVALLPAVALLAPAAPAQAQSVVWSATLNPVFFSFNDGCDNDITGAECSSTAVLSEDSFTHDSTNYTITQLYVQDNGSIHFIVNVDFTTATSALTLMVGSTSLILAEGKTTGSRTKTWQNSGVLLPAGTGVAVSLVPTTTNNVPELLSISRWTPQTSPTNADTLTWRVVFSEPVSNVDAADFAVSGTTATVTAVVATSVVMNAYDVTASGGDLASVNGTVALTISSSHNIVDGASAALSNTVPTGTNNNSYVLDNTAPSVTLVSNATQGSDNSWNDSKDRSQPFTTGAAGATLSSVEILSEDTDVFAVSLCTVDGSNHPTSDCKPLTAPSSFAAGTIVFTAPDDTTLDAATTYTLLITSTALVNLDATSSDNEDAGGVTGWSIADTSYSETSSVWTSRSTSLRITIKGTITASSNNAPTVATAISDQTAMSGTVFSYQVPDATFADADDDTLTYAATLDDNSALPAWLSFDAATRTFSGTPTTAETVSVKVTASDGNGGSVSDTFDIVVSAATVVSGDVLVSNINQAARTNNHAFGNEWAHGFVTGSNSTGYNLTSIELKVRSAFSGGISVSLWSANSSDQPDSQIFDFVNPADILTAMGTLSFMAPSNTELLKDTRYFIRIDDVTASGTPGSIEGTMSIVDDTGGAPGWSIDDANFFKRAGVGNWLTTAGTCCLLKFTVNGSAKTGGTLNNAPTVATEIPNQTATTGAAFSYEVPANTFNDADGDTLTYTAMLDDDTALPSWLSFAPATRTFSGTPTAAETVSVKVTASDASDSVSDTFDIVVTRAANNAAMGEPTISGTARVGRTLTASTTGITDADGLTSPTYTYQWIRVNGTDVDIASANSSTYTLVVADLGKTIKVEVSFTDDASNTETLTSAAYPSSGTVQANNVLVSNIGNHNSGEASALYDIAQAFTTGDNATGYTLTSIELRIERGADTTPTVKLYSGSATGTEEATLTGPATWAGSGEAIFTFTPSLTVTLLGSTTYWVVVERAGGWILSSVFTEEGTSATGWSIANGFGLRLSSSAGSFTQSTDGAYLFRVTGTLGGIVLNNAPTVATEIPNQTAMSGTAFSYQVPAATFADADSDTLTYAATLADDTDLPSWLSFDPATHTFSGTPTAVETVSVKVTASDGNGGSVSDTFDIVVSAATVVLTGQLFVDNTGEVVSTDAIVNGTVSQAFTTGPNTGGYILTSISVVANLIASGDTFSLAVHTADTNGAPVALHASMIAPGNFPAGESTITFSAPPNTMLEADTPYAIVLGQVGSTSRTLRTTNSNADNAGTSGWSIDDANHFYSVGAMAWRRSTGGRSVKIAIRGTAAGTVTNNAPTVATEIPDQMAMSGTAFSYEVPAATFADADSDTLTYTATLADDTPLPSWLSFAPATRTFSGTPTAAETVSVKVTASDGNGGSVSDTFDIVVSAAVTGICSRTAEVQTALLAATSRTACADVTAADLVAVTSLTVSNYSGTSLDPADFAGLTGLTSLRFSGDSAYLTTLPANAFAGATALTDLSFYFLENVTTVAANAFNGLTALETLNLSNNRLETLPADAFNGLTALRMLDLSINDLTSLDENIFDGLTALEELTLASNTDMAALHADIFDGLTNLHTLQLGYISLTTLDADIFDGLTALRLLALSDNFLTTLDVDIFDGLTALEAVSLNNNLLTTLHADIFDGLTALLRVYLSGNLLTTLDADLFDGRTVLQEILLDHNSLDTLDVDIFDGLTALEELQLQDNRLTALDANLFEDLTALDSLDLNCNYFTALDFDIFDPFAATLTKLNLQSDSFTTPPTDAAIQAKFTNIVTVRTGARTCDRVTVSPTSLTVTEGATGTYTVALRAPPSDNVMVAISSDNTKVTLSPAGPLTFTASNWDTPQMVTVSAAHDTDDADESATLILDPAGSEYDAVNSTALTVTVTDDDGDTTAPRVASIVRETPTSSPTNADSLTWRVTFSEAVSNVDAADFVVSGTTATVTAVAAVSGVTGAYDVTASGGNLASVSATVTLTISSSHNIEDGASNDLSNTAPTGTNDNSYVVDNTAPTVTISGVPSASNAPFTATFTFSEAVTGFAVGDITLTNATVSNFTATSTTVYTALVTPTASGTVTVNVLANAARDAAGNGNTAASLATLIYTPPAITITAGASPVTEGTSAVFTLSRAGSTTAALTVNVTVSEAGGDMVAASNEGARTVAFLANSATVTLSIATASDSVDEANSVVTATISADTGTPASYSVGTPASAMVTVEDNDTRDVTVSTAALTVNEGTTGTYTVVLNSQPTASVTVTPSRTGSSDVTFSPPTLTFTTSTWNTAQTVTVTAAQDSDAVADSATISHAVTGGDYAAVTADSVVVTVDDDETADTTAPRVASIVRQVPTSSPTNADSLTWRVTFSEAVSNVDAADFAVSGTTATVTAVAAVSGLTGAYDVSASGGNLAALNATVTLAIAASHNIEDGATNALTNTAPTGTNNNSYVVDNTAPSVTISGVPATSNAPFTATFTFSEAVTGFAAGDITLTNASASSFTVTSTTVYTALITPAAAGAVTVDVPANAAQDAAGNGNTAAARATSTYTGSAALPAITIAAGASPVTEGTSAVFTLSRTGSTTDALTVNVTVSEAGGDMVAASNEGDRTVTFLANSTTVTLSIATASDSVAEAHSVVTATISADTGSPASYSVGAPGSAMVTVRDDDSNITVPGAPTDLSASAAGETQINLSWTAPTDDGGSPIIGYKIEVSPDGAADWTELVANTGNANTTYEHMGLTVGTTRHYRVSAINSDGAGDPSNIDDAIASIPTVTLRTQTVLESIGTAMLVVTLDQPAGDPLSVRWYTLSSTAMSPGDYTNGAGTLIIPSGVTNATISITIIDDAVEEATETFLVLLSAGEGYDLGGSGATSGATVSILDDDGDGLAPIRATVDGATVVLTYNEPLDGASTPSSRAFVLRVAGNRASVEEVSVNGSEVTLTLAAPVPAGQTVSLDYTQPMSNPIQDGSGKKAQSFTRWYLVTESTITITNPVITVPGAPTALSATAVGNTQINLSWTAPGENGGAPISGYKIEVSPDGNADWTVLVANTGTTTYAHIGLAVGTTRHYRVSAINSVGAGAPSNIDDAIASIPTVTLRTQSVPEGIDTALLVVTLNEPAGDPLSVPWYTRSGTAESPGDYTAGGGQLIIPSGATSATISITIIDDADEEATETVLVLLSPGTGYELGGSGATLSILDDDGDGPAPSGATVDGATVVLTYNKPLDGASTPSSTAFHLRMAGDPVSINEVSVDGSEVTLTLAAPVQAGQTVSLDYTQPVSDPIQDASGNKAQSFTRWYLVTDSTMTGTVDTTAPRVASIVRETPTSSPTNADSLTWRVTFSEAVSNVDAADFAVSGTTATVTAVATVSGVTGGYDVTASGGNLASVNATVALTISASHNIEDGASNALTNTAPTGTNNNSYVLDNTAPSVTISGVPAASDAPFTATFTFSEAVTGFAAGDITLGNATASSFTVTSTTVSTALITPAAAGAVTVNVPANAAQDAAGNGNTAATVATTIYTPPAITIVAGASPVTEGTSAVFTLSRTGSPTAALTVNVTVSETGGDMVAASNEGARTVAFLANSATATLSVATASDSVDEANSVVTATISADTGSPASYSVGTPASAMVTVEDNDTRDVTVSTAALPVNEGSTGTYTVVLNSQPTASVTVTPSRTGSSDVTFSPPTLTFTTSTWNTAQQVTVTAAQDSDAVDDSATISHAVTGGDYAAVTADSVVVTVDDDETADTTAPRVASIARQNPTSSPTNADSLTWRVTFSEAVSNVDAADFAVSGTTATVTAVAAVSGVTGAYDVTASGGNLAALNATVTLAIAASHNIQDGAGNELTNTAPTGTNNNSYVVDNTAPSVTISGVPATSDAPFTATFTFSEAVTGFAAGDITLTNASASSFTVTSTMVFTALITPAAAGAVTVDVPANAAQDAAGNGNTAAARATSTYTGTAALPAITIAAGASPVTEGTSAVFTLSRTGSTTDALTVNVTVSEAGGDMVAASNEGARTVTFLANSTTVTLSIATASDSVAEANSVVTATISADTGSPASYSVGAPGSAMVTVRDDDSNITVPGAPTDLSATAAGETQINLSWTAPTDDGGSPIIGYKIEVSPDGAADWTELVANTGNANTTYEHIGLTAGTTRHYRVSAINSAGAGDPSNIDDAIASIPTVTLRTQTVLESIGTAMLVVTLDQPAGNPLSVPWYTLSGTAMSPGDYTNGAGTLIIPSGVTSATISITIIDDAVEEPTETVLVLLSPGTGYELGGSGATVSILDDDGDGPAPSGATVDGATVVLTYNEPLDGASTPSSTAFVLRVAGNPVSINEVSVDGSEVTLTLAAPVPAGQTVSLDHTQPMSNPIQDASGNKAQSFTRWYLVTESTITITNPVITVPGAPTALSATAVGNTQINLSWTAPGENGGAPISGYKIESSPDGVANWTELVANTGNTTTTYAHIGLAAGTTRHYRVSAINSAGAGDPSNIDDATTGAITGPITTGGGGGGGGGGPTPSEVDFEWNVKRDIEQLDGGNDWPTGLWSDGETLWIAENGQGADDEVYAYDRASGERLSEREFTLADTNRAPRGIWSDGETVWVSDSGRERLFAYDLATGERLEEREFALAEGNSDARGIWSDGETMWVLDGRADALFAYDFGSGELLGEYEFDSANGDPHGIWSDGVTVWVSDHGAKRLFAYRLPAPGRPAAEDTEPQDLERVRDEEFSKLSRASNNSPRGIWSDGDVMYVADESDDRVYTYNMPDAIDARLASLSLSGVDIGEFSPNHEEYEGVPSEGVTETTIEATTVQRRTDIAIDPPDGDGNEANGHQVALEGVSEITVTVTSADGSRERVYRVAFTRAVAEIALDTGWNTFAWSGAGGVAIADALRGDGDLANDISAAVAALYGWDEEAGAWLAFFPALGDVPGVNTLATLEQGGSYWIAVTEPVTWTVPALITVAEVEVEATARAAAFAGTVTGPSEEVAEGLAVEAYVGDTRCNAGEPVATYRALEDGGAVTRYYASVAHGDQLAGCATAGADVTFRIGDRAVVETGTWDNTAYPWQTLDLTLARETETIDVAVWRRNEDPFNALADLFISTRAPGENWDTHDDDGPLAMTLYTSPRTGAQNWYRSDLTPVEVVLADGSTVTIDVAVWRNVGSPTRLFISTRVPGEGWDTHDDDGPLAMTLYTSPRSGAQNWYRSDLMPIEVALQ